MYQHLGVTFADLLVISRRIGCTNASIPCQFVLFSARKVRFLLWAFGAVRVAKVVKVMVRRIGFRTVVWSA